MLDFMEPAGAAGRRLGRRGQTRLYIDTRTQQHGRFVEITAQRVESKKPRPELGLRPGLGKAGFAWNEEGETPARHAHSRAHWGRLGIDADQVNFWSPDHPGARGDE